LESLVSLDAVQSALANSDPVKRITALFVKDLGADATTHDCLVKTAAKPSVSRLGDASYRVEASDISILCSQPGVLEAHVGMSFDVTSETMSEFNLNGKVISLNVVKGPVGTTTAEALNAALNLRNVALGMSLLSDNVKSSVTSSIESEESALHLPAHTLMQKTYYYLSEGAQERLINSIKTTFTSEQAVEWNAAAQQVCTSYCFSFASNYCEKATLTPNCNWPTDTPAADMVNYEMMCRCSKCTKKSSRDGGDSISSRDFDERSFGKACPDVAPRAVIPEHEQDGAGAIATVWVAVVSLFAALL